MELEGRVAVVTGGASGIGRAAAESLVASGARVWIGDIDEKRGAEAAEACGAGFHALDITRDDSVEAFAKAVRSGGTPDILVNAAGWDRFELFLDNTPEFQEKVIDLNLMGPVRMSRTLLPGMIEAGGGKIVNVASDAGRVGSTGETIYAGAKGGVIAFSKSLAREMVRHQIHVNCVCPGPTDTPLFASLPEKMRDALVRSIPFRRLAKPEEVANVIAFFAGPRSDYVTGQVISVSGGLTMAG